MYLLCQCYICTMCLQLKAHPMWALINNEQKPRMLTIWSKHMHTEDES